MKNKLFAILTCVLTLLLCAFTFTACDEVKEDSSVKISGLQYKKIVGKEAYEVSGLASIEGTVIKIPSTHNGLAVTAIGNHAFYNCSNITSVEIPDSVTSIGYYAFYNCNLLTSVEIPSSVTSIGDNAFYNCKSLTSVEIPGSVTSIGDSAFYNCNSLISVNIENGVQYIGASAFYNCTSLSLFEIPQSVVSIGESVFGNCIALDSLTANENNQTFCVIEGNLYSKDKTQLLQYISKENETSFTVPNGVTNIAKNAFSGNRYLTSISLSNTVEFVESYAFANCSSLESVQFTSALKKVGYKVSFNSPNLKTVNYTGTVDDWVQIEFVDQTSNPLTLSAILKINGETVTEANITTASKISDYAFMNYAPLTFISIGESVNSIGKNAFFNCKSITSVEMSAKVSTVGAGAFNLYPYMEKPPVLKFNCIGDINDWAQTQFENESSTPMCKNSEITFNGEQITEVVFDKATKIGDYTFYNCDFLTSVTFGDGVTEIGKCAFWDCDNIPSVKFTNNLISIGYKAFYDCELITSLEIPDSVTEIGESVFAHCEGLSSLIIGDGLTIIPTAAFEYCKSLSDIEFGKNIISIGDYAFRDCDSIISVVLIGNITSVGSYAFYSCNSLTAITGGEKLNSIGIKAFTSGVDKYFACIGEGRWYKTKDYEKWLNKTGGTVSVFSGYMEDFGSYYFYRIFPQPTE